MGYLVSFLFVLSLALIGKSMVGFLLVLPFVMAFAFRFEAHKSFLMAFFSGILMSIVDGSVLGRESLGMLLAAGLIHLYGRRFSSRHWIYFIVFAGLGSVLYDLVNGNFNSVWRLLIRIVMVLIFIPVISYLKERFFSEKIILKV